MATTAAEGVDEAVAQAAYLAARVARLQAETAVDEALSAKNQADAITVSSGSNSQTVWPLRWKRRHLLRVQGRLPLKPVRLLRRHLRHWQPVRARLRLRTEAQSAADAAASAAATAGGVAQVDTVTLGFTGALEAGDAYTVIVSGNTATFTITDAHIMQVLLCRGPEMVLSRS